MAEDPDKLLEAVQRRAMEVIQTPPERREALYEIYRRAYVETAESLGMPKDIADKMVEWTKAMVNIIETGGGQAGGSA